MCLLDIRVSVSRRKLNWKRVESDWRWTVIAASAALPAATRNLCVKKACELSDKITSSQNIIPLIQSRRMRWRGHVVRVGEKRNACRVLAGKTQANRSLWRPRCRWKDNIKADIKEIIWDAVDWIDLAQNRYKWRDFVNAVMNQGLYKTRGI
jgi:hypothetical protein